MHGLMQDRPLSLPMLMNRIDNQYGHRTVTTEQIGYRTTTTYRELAVRIRTLAAVLDRLGIPARARVGTVGWNTQRHLELYMAIPCSNRILHTLNHRLFEDQLRYIIDDAQDDVIFVDRSILGMIWNTLRDRASIRHIVVMDDGDDFPLPDDPRILDYEELMGSTEPIDYEFTIPDDRTAASLCYTSGTTGNPKGVLYDHRSIILHVLLLMTADSFAIQNSDVILPIVPMFHVNAWGLPYAALMCGADLVMPGTATKPDALVELMERHRVTFAAAVATVWNSIATFLDGRDLSSIRMVVCGGGAVPLSLTRTFIEKVGVPLENAWGMTETSPVVTGARQSTGDEDLIDEDERLRRRSSTGPALPLTELRLMNDDGTLAPHDGMARAEVQVAGPTIASGYFGTNTAPNGFTKDGWLRTGDVATIDPYGNIQIVDRVKDLIKSGGEWISSVELEHAIVADPRVAEAAVVAVSDEQWGERPMAVVVPNEGATLTAENVREFLRERVAKWWIPETVAIVSEIPKTATGKISKVRVREELAPGRLQSI